VPFTTGPNDHLSLPSGDATVAFALSAVMAGMIENRLWKIAWYGLAVVTALSRIYHDQHWLSDVLLSTIIGTIVGVWMVNKHLIPLRAEPEDV
jgi:membrane-associated phospholipid phosphatase